jgi:adenine deaminase
VGCDEDIAAVANCLIEMGGGAAVAVDGKVVAKVEMPLLGLMPTDPLDVTVEKWKYMNKVLNEALRPKNPTPWRALGFPCMPRAIPSLKICQAGLADVTPRSAELVSLFVD